TARHPYASPASSKTAICGLPSKTEAPGEAFTFRLRRGTKRLRLSRSGSLARGPQVRRRRRDCAISAGALPPTTPLGVQENQLDNVRTPSELVVRLARREPELGLSADRGRAAQT